MKNLNEIQKIEDPIVRGFLIMEIKFHVLKLKKKKKVMSVITLITVSNS